ncbi:DUF6907 domain-containing protein [Actinomadura flavalba]|uniref:DUF6907 domain-containing protein n=1 Tax=Actinomadura flavalba TaxID=1120938 RepID=UPI000382AFB8|nr:hypothetical protein [Actinomadura flavalba]
MSTVTDIKHTRTRTHRAAKTAVCPTWCVNTHDHPLNVEHFGDVRDVELSNHFDTDLNGRPIGLEMTAHLRTPEHDPSGVANVCVGNHEQNADTTMTLDEAENFAFALLRLVAQGRK